MVLNSLGITMGVRCAGFRICLLVLSLLTYVQNGFCEEYGFNRFGEHHNDLLETARRVQDILAVTHPVEGPHNRPRRSIRPSELSFAKTSLATELRNASFPDRLRFTEFADRPTPQACRSCYIMAHNVIDRIRNFQSREGLVKLVTDLCIRLNIAAPNVCKGMVEINVDIVSYVLKASPKVDTAKVCATVLAECDYDKADLHWPIKVSLDNKPPAKPQPFLSTLRPAPKRKPVRILQVTDFHYDTMYQPDGNTACGMPVCCRKNQGNASIPNSRAGRWGDYRFCDIPWETVLEFCQHVTEEQKVDYIYFTGDIIDHGVWATSRDGNIRMVRDVFRTLKETFGRTKVFPVVGNHEPHPMNQFAPGDLNVTDELSSRWLYEVLADEWAHWLPVSTRETILKGGFYTVRVENNLRIVALNTMFCYKFNWWLMLDPVDPAGQLSWLADVLLKAEAAGEKVHILSHIPPGNGDCLTAWSKHYWRIVKRFSDTIVAQFNGHSHWDELRVFYTDDGTDNTWAFNSAVNGGSLTTFANVNPNYKIYLVDGRGKNATWEVRDAEVWTFNLTDANSRPTERPHWFKMYSFAEKYNVPSMHVSNLDKLVRRFASNRETRYLYWKLGAREADSRLSWGCDDNCIRPILCNIVTTETRHNKYCDLFFKNMS